MREETRTVVIRAGLLALLALLVALLGSRSDGPLLDAAARVLFPLRPSGYIPKDFVLELHVGDMGFDAVGIEGLVTVLLNVTSWVVAIFLLAPRLSRWWGRWWNRRSARPHPPSAR